jgi:hypothetical protein
MAELRSETVPLALDAALAACESTSLAEVDHRAGSMQRPALRRWAGSTGRS